jgi:F-type H+-transporting ATPase subunit a
MKHGMKFLNLFAHQAFRCCFSAGALDRGDLLPLASDQPVGPSVRKHAGRSHHAESFRRLHRVLSAAWRVGIVGAILPLSMTVALTALEFLVAFLQAYVFTVLTCMYLNDAIHPSH